MKNTMKKNLKKIALTASLPILLSSCTGALGTSMSFFSTETGIPKYDIKKPKYRQNLIGSGYRYMNAGDFENARICFLGAKDIKALEDLAETAIEYKKPEFGISVYEDIEKLGLTNLEN